MQFVPFRGEADRLHAACGSYRPCASEPILNCSESIYVRVYMGACLLKILSTKKSLFNEGYFAASTSMLNCRSTVNHRQYFCREATNLQRPLANNRLKTVKYIKGTVINVTCIKRVMGLTAEE